MSIDLASLFIKVDSSGVVKADKDLNNLAGTAEKTERATTKASTSMAKSWLTTAVAAAALVKLAQQSVQAFMEEERAQMKLAVAMRNAGTYTRENFSAMKEYAAQLQKTTAYADNLAIATMGTLQSYGMSTAEVKRATKAVMDLATAKEMDLVTAANLVGKAFVGETGTLSRYGIIIGDTKDKTEKFEKVLTQINERFGGAAQADLETYGGQWAQLKNMWGDITEVIGMVLLKALEAVHVAVGLLGVAFNSVLESIVSALSQFIRFAEFLPFIGDKVKAFREEIDFIASGYGAAKDKALEFTDKNYNMLTSFDKVETAAEKMASGGIKKIVEADEAAIKAAEKLQAQWAKTKTALQDNINKSGLTEFEAKLYDIRAEAEKLRAQFGGIPGAGSKIGEDERIKTDQAYTDEAKKLAESRVVELVKEHEARKEGLKLLEGEQKELENIARIMTRYADFSKGIDHNLMSELEAQYAIAKELEVKQHEYIQSMLEQGVISHTKAEEDKLKATANRIKTEKALTSEKFMRENTELQGIAGATADMFSMAANLYAEDSKERQKLSDLSKAATVAEIALQVQKNLMIAVGAVVNQGTGDPYTAFARIAAMVAVVSGVLSIAGIALGGGGGGGGVVAPGPVMGNSTVLGAAYGTESESIANSLEILQDTYDLENSKLTKIYDELRALNNNITGLVSGIIRTGGSFDGMTIESDAVAATRAREVFMLGDGIYTLNKWGGEQLGIKNLELWANPISYIVNSLLGYLVQYVVTGILGGEKTINTIGAGYKIGGSSIKDIMSGGVNTQQYQTIMSKTSGGWFGDDKVSIGTIYSEVDAEVANLFNKVFQNLGGTLVGLAELLGTDINDALAYKLKDIKFNLMGKDGEEISEAISEALSAAGDNAAKALFGELISRYQQVNEGMLETAVRLVTDKESVLAVLRLTNQSFEATTSKLIEFSESLISVAGSLDELTDAFQTYYDAFFSDAEKQADTKTALSGALGLYGYDLPGTRSGYRALVESLNLTTEAGMSAYAALMKMSESADTYYDYIEKAKGSIRPENYATRIDYQRALAGFAEGGISSGPESGYEARLHGTELIVSPKKGYSATVVNGDSAELVAELKATRKAIEQGNFYTKANTDHIVKLMDRNEAIGPKAARTS